MTSRNGPIPILRSKLAPLLRPLHAFLAAESAGGLLLLAATLVALTWANSPWGDGYGEIWNAKRVIGIGGHVHAVSLVHCVNDGLMVIFFLLVGLEIKRELLIGELASLRRATLPLAAAVGGMAVPALLYSAFTGGRAGAAGWGIPMATDIAFAVGILSLVGRAVPTSVKVFLLAIAIIDDLGAVVVIAAFYSGHLSGVALAIAGAFFAALIALNRLRIHRALPYMLLGIGLWAATLYSGIHATIAGVLLAFTLPATRQAEDERDHVQSPLARVEHALLRPVNFLIVPLFALANAGVDLRAGSGAALGSAVTWGVLLGLMIGKPVGVLLASWAAIKIGVATLPQGATRRQLVGVAVLCGIGFTMSLFVANLAFPQQPAHLASAKIGILGASLICGVAGGAVIATGRRR